MERKPALTLAVMCAGMFLVLLDVTVINVAVPSINAGLRTTTAGIQWVVAGYTVALACLLLAGGALGDRLGHRRVVAAGLAVFGAASAGCALAPTTDALIATRVAQGFGAALLLPGSVAAIANAYPEQASQARALGIWAGVSSLALPAGPLLGGLLVTALGWRAVFWINPPVVALCLAAVFLWVPADHDRRTCNRAGLLGQALSLFRHPAFRAANASALGMNLTTNGLLFLLTRYLQSVLGHGPLDAGVILLPLFVPLAVLSPVAGRLVARHGPRPVMLAGALLAAAGQLSLLLVTTTTGYPQLIPALAGVGIGLGLFTAPVVATAIRAAPAEQSGLSGGVNNTARQAGTALGIALYGAIAGDPAHPDHFIAALRDLGIAAAIIWTATAALIATATSQLGAARRV